MASFISTNVFETKAKVRREEQKILTWSDLPQNHIYQITEVEFVEDGKFGPAHILFLTDKDNRKCKVWGPKKLVKELQRKDAKDIPYMISLGQEPYGKTKTINLYDLAFEKGEEILSLFTSSSSSPPPQKKRNE